MEFDLEILMRFLLAGLWGSLVGAEREYRGKAAGFRTTIMISIGACFFTMMSIAIGNLSNPDRIASNIVTGIGFLGAGVIFKGDNRVNGITTAATIWTVAAVGMGIGGGYYFASACGSILILFILSVLPLIERYIDRIHQTKNLLVKCSTSQDAVTRCEQLMQLHKLKYRLIKTVKDEDTLFLTWQLQGSADNMNSFIGSIIQIDNILRFEF